MERITRYGKLIAFALIVAVIVIMNNRYHWSAYLGDIKNFGFLQEMVKENLLLASLWYMGLTIVGCVVLALPGITFAVFAGLLFGPWLGTIECLVATTIGALLAYLTGRFFLKDTIKPIVMRNEWLKRYLFDETGHSDMVLLMVTRLVPLFPYNLQNFAYGITDIRWLPYTVYTFVFMAPGVAMFTIGSAGLVAGGSRWLYLGLAAALLAVVLLLGKYAKRFL